MNTIFDLINNLNIYKELNNIDKQSLSNKGLYYEKFIKLLIICNKFKNYQLLDKNYKKILNKEEYLKKSKIFDSCFEGKIDIKLFDGINYFFVSCKYFNEEKTLNYYGILEMNEEIKNKGINNYSLGLFIKDKNEFIKKYNRSRNYDIKKLINLDNVYDYNYFLNIINDFKFDNSMLLTIKPELKLRFYQNNIINKIKIGNNLIGACPRSGKSYMIGGFIDKYKFNNILIITPIIKETKTQWINDIFNKYSNFENYKILNPLSNIELNNIKLKDNNIIIISKQLLQNHYKEFNFKPDLLVFDEHDFTGTTDLSKDIIKKYECQYNIYLTATYYKSLINVKKLNKIIFTYEELRQYENKYPEPIYFTPRFEINYFNKINNELENNFNFNYSLLFEIDNKTKKFKNEEKVIDFINYYLSGNKICPIHPISKRINKYLMKQSTQLWFLPLEHINEISKNLKILLNEDLYYRDYNIICINSKNKIDNINYFIEDEENKVIKENKKGLIILVGGMLQRGITLKNCNAVFFLNNTTSYEKYIQCKFRCLSEKDNKKYGIIVDFDINRILSIILNYSNNKINIDMPIIDKIKLINEEKLINFDPDMLETYNFDGDKSLNNLLELWNNNPINQLKIYKKLIEEEYENIDLVINNELLKIFESIKILDDKTKKDLDKDKIKLIDELIKDENIPKQELKKKKEEILKENKNIINELETKKKISKEIIPYIIPLSCILTYNNNENEFIKILNIIKNDDILKDIFNSQCEMIWEKNGFLDFIIQLVNDLNINPSNWINNIKYNINQLLNYPDKLIDFINECLVIKKCEEINNAEYPTSPVLINEMLDKLEEYEPDIFKKNLKWFDHSCGIGNFMVCLYLRLIKYYTREEIINDMLYMCEYQKKNVFILRIIFGQKAHIYQGSTIDIPKDNINGLNVKEYFGINKFDIILGNPPYQKDGIKSCTGKKLIKNKTSQNIWPSFINFSFQYLKEDGYFISINPLSWMKKTHKLFNIITNKNILWLKLTTNTEAKQIINACIPLSFIILQNNSYKHKTEIKRKEYNEITDLNNNYSLPLGYFNIFNKLNSFIINNNLKLEFKNKVVKSEDKKIIINNLNNIKLKDNYGINTYTLDKGYEFKKMLKKHADSDKTKLIIPNKCSFKGCFIDNGNIGLVGTHKYYILGDNLEILLNMLNYKFINLICEYTKYSQDFVDNEVFNFIPDIRKLKNINYDNLTEEYFYNLVGFNKDEIKIINKF